MVDSYQRQDIDQYESILKDNPEIMKDPFIAENIATVTRSIRTSSVLKIVAPYNRFSFDFIAKKLRISHSEVQDIVSFLILDKRLDAQIDQTRGTVEKTIGVDVQRVQAVDQWTSAIDSLWSAVLRSTDVSRSTEDGAGGPGVPPLAASQGFPDAFGNKRGRRQQQKKPLYTGA